MGTTRVTADGIPGDVLESLTGLFEGTFLDCPTSSGGAPAAGGAGVLLMGRLNAERLTHALTQPFHGFVEVFDNHGFVDVVGNQGFVDVVDVVDPGPTLAERIAIAAEEGDFCLHLTTPTAFGAEAAKAVCDGLVCRGVLPLPLRPVVEMALHETVANAVLHGNLGLESGLKAGPDCFESFCRRMKDLLQNPESHRRWIQVTARWTDDQLELSVEDQGQGYEISEGAGADDIDERPFGRGLAIVHALASDVTISKGGRCTTLRFVYDRS